MEDYACLCINAGGGDDLISADSGVADRRAIGVAAYRSTGLARGWADTLAIKVPALSADIACSAKLSTLLSVAGPATRSRGGVGRPARARHNLSP